MEKNRDFGENARDSLYWTEPSDKDSNSSSTNSISFCELPFDSDEEEEYFRDASRSSIGSMDSIADLEEELVKLCRIGEPWDEYEKHEMIGAGGSGRVYRAVHMLTGRQVAIKEIFIAQQNKKQLILNEVCALRHIGHPNIVPMVDAFYYQHALKHEPTIAIVTHYCEHGSLTDICGTTVMPETLVAEIIKRVLLGLDELHQNRIAHRDLKTDNILVDSDCNVFLSDLGYCDVIDESTKCPESSVIGTPYWMAPEVVKYGETSLASDIWSIGLVAIELYDGTVPLYGTHSPKEAIAKIAAYSKPPIARKDRFSADFRAFLEACLQISPDARPTAGQLLKHPFLRQSTSHKDAFRRHVAAARRLKKSEKS